jgi:hypothetical protein
VDQFEFNVRRHVHEWKQFLKKEKNPTVQGNSSWEAPPNEWVKINTYEAPSLKWQSQVVGEISVEMIPHISDSLLQANYIWSLMLCMLRLLLC